MAYVLAKRLAGARTASSAIRHLSAEPRKLAAVMYTFVDEMLDKRGPYRAEHLDLLKKMTKEGDCLIAGAMADPCDGSFLLFSTQEKAKQFVEKDPYYTGGLVTNYQIRDYMAVVGTMLEKSNL